MYHTIHEKFLFLILCDCQSRLSMIDVTVERWRFITSYVHKIEFDMRRKRRLLVAYSSVFVEFKVLRDLSL